MTVPAVGLPPFLRKRGQCLFPGRCGRAGRPFRVRPGFPGASRRTFRPAGESFLSVAAPSRPSRAFPARRLVSSGPCSAPSGAASRLFRPVFRSFRRGVSSLPARRIGAPDPSFRRGLSGKGAYFPRNSRVFLLPNGENKGIFFAVGPVAQLVEPPAHNRIVVGSKPAGSTTIRVMTDGFFRPFSF